MATESGVPVIVCRGQPMHYNGAVSGCIHRRDVVVTKTGAGSTGRRPRHVVKVPLLVRVYATMAI